MTEHDGTGELGENMGEPSLGDTPESRFSNGFSEAEAMALKRHAGSSRGGWLQPPPSCSMHRTGQDWPYLPTLG